MICVSKFHPKEAILEAYQVGERCFGENRPQEMASKTSELPQDIEWHFIGNLQTNKVKQVVPIASLIHSVSNIRLIEEINKTAEKLNITVNVLLELFVAQEESKHGFETQELIELLTPDFIKHYPNIRICGVMGMATFTDNKELIRKEFKTIAYTFKQLKEGIFKDNEYFKEISMGMSDDYKIAIEEGATMVRIGSTIFGHRNYNL